MMRAGLHRDLDAIPDDARREYRERLIGGCAERPAVPDVEGGAVQRADQTSAAQTAFAEPREGMGADIVERMHAVLRSAHHDLPAADHVRSHRAFGYFRERNGQGFGGGDSGYAYVSSES